MTTEQPSAYWGDWSVGDLADVARDVANVLGPSQEVDRISIKKTVESEYPIVEVSVPDEAALRRLRNSVKSCGYEVQFLEATSANSWTVEVMETVLTVQSQAATS